MLVARTHPTHIVIGARRVNIDRSRGYRQLLVRDFNTGVSAYVVGSSPSGLRHLSAPTRAPRAPLEGPGGETNGQGTTDATPGSRTRSGDPGRTPCGPGTSGTRCR